MGLDNEIAERSFRWTDAQKSRFIESILLGIPIPSIFVSQDDDGKWELIDGIRRLSTILQLMGELRDAEGNTVPPLILKKTKYLPSLEGKRWISDSTDKEDELSSKTKLIIKRARIDIKIVLNKNKSAKYEMFDRLNTIAADQEIL